MLLLLLLISFETITVDVATVGRVVVVVVGVDIIVDVAVFDAVVSPFVGRWRCRYRA